MAPKAATVANDAHLVQLVRGSVGHDLKTLGLSRSNISSCRLVVTLHGRACGAKEHRAIEKTMRRVPGVRGVINKIPRA